MSLDRKRWLILVLQIFIMTAVQFPYLLSVLAGPLNETKGWPIATLMLVFTFAMWVSTPAMIICGKLRDKIGNRKLIACVGLIYALSVIASGLMTNVWGFVVLGGAIAGFGMMGIFVAVLANIGMLFPDKRGLATGINTAGYSFLLAAIMVPVAQMINITSVVTVVIGCGIVFGVVIIVGSLFVIDPPGNYCPEGWDPNRQTADTVVRGPEYTWNQMIKTPAFYLLEIAMIGLMTGGFAFSSNVSLMAQTELGISDTQGAVFSTLIMIASGIGGVLAGTLIDKAGGGKSLMIINAISFVGLAVYIFVAKGSYVVFAFAAIVSGGICQGAWVTALSTIVMNTYGEKNYGVNFGIASICSLIASTMGPVLAGSVSVIVLFMVVMIINIVGLIGAAGLIRTTRNIFSDWEKNQS